MSYERLDLRYRALLRYPSYGWVYILSLPAGLLLGATAFLTVERPEYATALTIAVWVTLAFVGGECVRRAEAAFSRVADDSWRVPSAADVRAVISGRDGPVSDDPRA